MLLEFRTKNYKSFEDELTFSLVPAPKQKGLDYSLLEEAIGKKIYKGLCSAVIYGPNASGKTNIIGAMDTFKSIVLRGNIRNDEDKSDPNAAATALELIPNNSHKNVAPVYFSIKFISNGMLVEYSFSADFGKFLETDYQRRILSETLKINNSLIFSRNEGLKFDSLDAIQELLVNAFEQNSEGAIALAKSNLNDEELFLMNGFKTMFSSKLVALISSWLDNKFMIIYRADSMNLIRKFSDPKKKSVYIEKTINEAATYFGINSNAIGYVVDGDNNEAKLCSIFSETKRGTAIPAELFESYGTIRFVNMFPLVVNALLNGGTLVVDEFDASIHPMALMNIINIFHNDEINIHHAQLIFNTHNPIFLNANLYRRDEIKFVERDEKTHYSSHYSLSDFGTTGKSGVRKNEDYMKNYFVDRYGAIKDVDFTPIFEKLMSHEEEV
ncbi:MAG: ATP-binding protein [Clostridium sp.]|jgi:AAA15 family ATPase/GTPase|uniref:AAA family ATPase n=1 Tax=Clostridium sp. TaxID=1506 RepID=UPI0025B8BC6D|nr:ATP-binding protein [Clostridium sp.]MCH3965061.1 ATP-binding protein [Clostridium sp.]MCI1714282.1 ATP-binding protein [Clostridium sp.]MCI1798544.1 ATP-binding protein [Clostridium sp.]MCI1812725.1 ATP-binding protein [Clostridium sp.]MCI1869353.1 ATP-binding protein [Clostridium sp.]